MSEYYCCKKCGWNRPRLIVYGHFNTPENTYRITCPKCSYCTKEKQTKEEAITAWNQRNGVQ